MSAFVSSETAAAPAMSAADTPRPAPQTPVQAPSSGQPASPPPAANGVDLVEVLSAASETAYRWDLISGEIAWAANAAHILGVADPSALERAASYSRLIDSDHANRHYEAVSAPAGKDGGSGVPYRIRYKLRPEGRRAPKELWVEDHGRTYAGPDGRPALARGVLRVINDRYEEEQRLLFLSRHDELTGQLNRYALTEILSDFLMKGRNSHAAGAFITAAVNNLSQINNTYGFGIGDEVIRIVGRRLRSCLRDDDAIGRLGSNKFGLVLKDCGPEQLEGISARLHRVVRDSVIETSAGSLSTGVCLGGLLIPQQARSVHEALSRSLEALEWARTKPGRGFGIYKASERRESQRQHNITLADKLISALNERRVVLALQPVVQSGSRRTVFYECLIRMREADGTVIPAGEFMPVAERIGLSRLIDHRVLELAVGFLRAAPGLRLSLNVSAETTGDPEWLAMLQALTRSDRTLMERLMVEITETAVLADMTDAAGFVRALKAMGCRAAIDDFGAGYSSFRNLRLLDVDMVKIDGSFIRDLGMSREDRVLVRSLVYLAQNFSLETVAEWVGDEQTARIVEEAGVTHMQGYYFGQPRLVEPERHAARGGGAS